jgi:hypothetical protein
LLALTSNAAAQITQQPAQTDSVLAISTDLCQDMRQRKVMNPGAPVPCERLRLVKFGFVGFDDKLDSGELVVMDAVADRVLEIFIALRGRRFPLTSAKLMNAYNGDDHASMDANNTSALNVRNVAGSNAISLHAYGLAIDLNPVQNPYVGRSQGTIRVSPKAGAAYLARKNLRPGMAETVVDLFADRGFLVWGGYWNNADYQHFQVSRKMAGQLAGLAPGAARTLFEKRLEAYRTCVQSRGEAQRRTCALAE